ncbi:MAG: peptidase T [Solirubrobacteraceae bacterium]
MPGFTSSLAEELAEDVLERFLRYVRIDTRAQLDRAGCPSTPGQLELGRLLVAELEEIGLEDVAQDANGYVFAMMSSRPPHGPAVGLLAHLDTSPEVSGAGVEPIVHRAYAGGAIELPLNGVVVDTPLLREQAGDDVVTASGDTLLGADDKAGIAEIMGALAHLAAHPQLPRPTLRICFLPDEEIGMGPELFDVARFAARCAYTMDGSTRGELQAESFTAAEILLTIDGVDIHPGFAVDKMVNALRLAGRILAALPRDLAPETTSGREGFIHPFDVRGGTAQAAIRIIVRDFEEEGLWAKVEQVRAIAEKVVAAEPAARLDFDAHAQYPNMRDHIAPFPEVLEKAERAIRGEGIEPIRTPIRGGTDGSRLSAMGLPTPNLFAGGHEFHSPREWVTVQDMAAASAVIVRLAGEWADAS